MVIVGLTGGSGTGKGEVSNCFLKLGAGIINADEVYHELLRNNVAMLVEIKEAFGDVIDENGELDRKALGAIVFSNPRALHKLNHITHKYISEQVTKKMLFYKEQGKKMCIFDAAVLFDSDTHDLCDSIIGVIARREKRIARIMERDGISAEYAALRIDAQKADEFYREKCDIIIENNTTFEGLYTKTSKIYNSLLENEGN